MNDTLKIIEILEIKKRLAEIESQTSGFGFSDTVILAFIAGVVAIATLIIKGFIDSRAEKAKTIAATEAAKVTQKLEAVELKIDGRLTELLRITKAEAEERGHRLGTDQEQARHAAEPSTASTELPSTGPVKLTITEGEMKVVAEVKKKNEPKKH